MLHAQLSPEAIQRLQTQKRNSTISSVLIALLTIVLIAVVLALYLLKPSNITPSTFNIIYIPPAKIIDDPTIKKQKVSTKQKPAKPSRDMARLIHTTASSPISVPVPETITDSPSVEFGESVNIGIGWEKNKIGNDGFEGIPEVLRSRCSPEERSKRMKESGGNQSAEKAVMKSLRWLKQTQNEDGSWGDKYPVAMTGFAVLAYLGHCETPKSPEFGDSVEAGIVYLINIGMKSDKIICTPGVKGYAPVYEHGIATYALAEATTFCSQLNHPIPNLKKVTKKAGEIIMDGQTPQGGWVYGFGGNGGDNSVGFWQIQALKACKHTQIWPQSKFKKPARNALAYLEKVQGQNGAIGYRGDSSRSPGLTGGGVLAFQFWGEGDSKPAKNGIEYIRKNSKFEWGKGHDANLYYHYYNAQAMINAGGDDWDHYNKMFRDDLINAQNDDGSWTQKMRHGPVNQHMATCLATFMLEVYYRFLPGTN